MQQGRIDDSAQYENGYDDEGCLQEIMLVDLMTWISTATLVLLQARQEVVGPISKKKKQRRLPLLFQM